ncbi:MAG: metalloregulator ArsR/SmtB family transcription factor [bacterium]|nr:metalloregulator ArsR/SmtB family transcription factor [bacterium]
METKQASGVFQVLASEVRLSLFRLLVRHEPEGLVAGEIAKALQVSNTNLSFHLKELLYTGLISVEKEGRFLRYRANIPLMLETIAFLTEECCSGQPELCRQYRLESSVSPAVLPSCACGPKE